jgi:hypothetical protein
LRSGAFQIASVQRIPNPAPLIIDSAACPLDIRHWYVVLFACFGAYPRNVGLLLLTMISPLQCAAFGRAALQGKEVHSKLLAEARILRTSEPLPNVFTFHV